MEIKLDTELLVKLQDTLESNTPSTDPQVQSLLGSLSAQEMETVKKLLNAIGPACFCNRAK